MIDLRSAYWYSIFMAGTLTVAIDALSLGSPPQGIGSYAVNLVRALAADPGDVSLIVFTPEDGVRHFGPIESSRVIFSPCRLPPLREGRIAFQHLVLPRLVRASGAHLLHGVGNVLPSGYRGPAVLTIHDLDFAVHPRNSSLLRRILFGRLTPMSLRKADLVMADSRATAESIREFYPWLPTGRIRVAHLGGPDPDRPSPEAVADVRRRRGVEQDYFLVVGSLETRKNVPLAIRSFEIFREKSGRPARLLLAGRAGHGSRTILETVARSTRSGEIVVAGYVPADELPALYAGAASLLLLSEAEGFGLPSLEAMARGCPVIAAQAGSLPEVCGEGAILVKPGDAAAAAAAMTTVTTDPAFRSRLVRRGAENAARFSWSEHARLVMTAYHDAFGGNIPGARG
jgi:glycosyltransferase involved in cell wall biosynthesis